MIRSSLIVLALTIVGCGPPPTAAQPGATEPAPTGAATVAPAASACELGVPKRCRDEAIRLLKAEGAARNEARGSKLMTQACEGGDSKGCALLGLLHQEGRGVAKDPAAALRSFEKGCAAATPEGCSDAGLMHSEGEATAANKKRAAELFDRGCEAGEAAACMELGVLLYQGEGGVPADLPRAAKVSERACNADIALACRNLGLLLSEPGIGKVEPARAATVMTKGCTLGDAGACLQMGVYHYKGVGVTQDSKAALAMFKKACDAKNEDACNNQVLLTKELADSAPQELAGDIISAVGTTVTIRYKSDKPPTAGARGELLKHFDTGVVTGWMTIAEVTVKVALPDKVVLGIDAEKSQVSVNGQKLNHFKPGTAVKLQWKPKP